jgi:hypothetical protein
VHHDDSFAISNSDLPVACAMIALDSLLSGHLCGRARLDLDLVAVGEIDRRIEDHLIAVLDAGAHLDGRTEVAAPQLSSGAIRIVDILKADAKRTQSGHLRLRAGDQRDSAGHERAVFREVAAHGPGYLKCALHDAAVDAERGACCC